MLDCQYKNHLMNGFERLLALVLFARHVLFIPLLFHRLPLVHFVLHFDYIS
uniref:Uncharacterized protein n=1 Tax=Oryza brachyantha TaxID=4533 RepID=J3LFW9_ORYBR